MRVQLSFQFSTPNRCAHLSEGEGGRTSENEIAAMKSIIISRAIKAIGAEGETD